MPSEEFLTVGREIPWAWSQVICSCIEPEYPHWHAVQRKETKDICLKCHKIPKWQLVTCRNCGDQYHWMFKHHAIFSGNKALGLPEGWAHHIQWCWKCICAKDPATEGDVPPEYIEAPRQATFVDLSDFKIEF